MPTKNTAQHLVPIKDIHDDVVILKDGKMCMVLLATSINFALKSADEQQAILSQFQSFLNSIDFSLQIFSQSRRHDMRPYLEKLQDLEPTQDNDLMRTQLREYIEFIKAFSEQVAIMKKRFFVVVSYEGSNIGSGGISKFLKSGKRKEEASQEKFFEQRIQLEQRLSIVEQGLSRVGIRTQLLNTDQLIELYYHIFNPEDSSKAPRQ